MKSKYIILICIFALALSVHAQTLAQSPVSSLDNPTPSCITTPANELKIVTISKIDSQAILTPDWHDKTIVNAYCNVQIEWCAYRYDDTCYLYWDEELGAYFCF